MILCILRLKAVSCKAFIPLLARLLAIKEHNDDQKAVLDILFKKIPPQELSYYEKDLVKEARNHEGFYRLLSTRIILRDPLGMATRLATAHLKEPGFAPIIDIVLTHLEKSGVDLKSLKLEEVYNNRYMRSELAKRKIEDLTSYLQKKDRNGEIEYLESAAQGVRRVALIIFPEKNYGGRAFSLINAGHRNLIKYYDDVLFVRIEKLEDIIPHAQRLRREGSVVSEVVEGGHGTQESQRYSNGENAVGVTRSLSIENISTPVVQSVFNELRSILLPGAPFLLHSCKNGMPGGFQEAFARQFPGHPVTASPRRISSKQLLFDKAERRIEIRFRGKNVARTIVHAAPT